jgi:hypothetical protein
MRGLLAVLVVSGLSVAAAATSSQTSAGSRSARCSQPLRALKTLSDPERWLVNLRPRATTIRAINRRARPQPTPTRRNDAFERQVWRVRAVVVKDRLDVHGSIEVVLSYRGASMIAQLPSPSCLPGTTRARRALVRARRRFEQGCGAPARSWTAQGAVAQISGVGLWNFPNRRSGHAQNYAELHPVTAVNFVVGCDGERRGGG